MLAAVHCASVLWLLWYGTVWAHKEKPDYANAHCTPNQHQIYLSVLLGNPYCEEFILLNMISHRNRLLAVIKKTDWECKFVFLHHFF